MHNKSAYIWGLVTRIAPAAMQLATNMILARFLSPDDFGTIGVLSIIYMVAGVFVDSGLGGSLIKEKEISKVDCSTISDFNLLISVIIYLILFAFSNALEGFFNIDNLSFIINLLSLTFIINAFGLVPKALLAREVNFKVLCYITIYGVVVSAIISIIMAYYGFGVYSLVAYQLLNCLVTTILAIGYTHYKFSIAFSYDSFRRLIPFGFYTSITTIIDSFYENLLTTITGKYLSISQAGYLSQAKKVEEGLTSSVASAISNVIFPILSKHKNSMTYFIMEADSITHNICKITFPFLLTIALYSNNIIIFLFGKQWAPASEYLFALIWAGLLLITETLLRSYIKSLCAVEQLAYITLVKRIIGIVVILGTLIIDRQNIVWGYVISTFIGYLLNLSLYGKLIEVPPLRLLFRTFLSVLPSIIYFVIFSVALKIINVSACMVLSMAILSVYYVIIYKEYKKK